VQTVHRHLHFPELAACYRTLESRPGMVQRDVKHADLLIATAAELAGMTLLYTTRTTT